MYMLTVFDCDIYTSYFYDYPDSRTKMFYTDT